MQLRIILLYIFSCVVSFSTTLQGVPPCEIDCNPYLVQYEKERITDQLVLPEDHPVFEFFTTLFHEQRVTESRESFEAAGFVVIKELEDRVAAYHPYYPEYILKLYFDVTPYRATERLLVRAETAWKMRKIIRSFGLKHMAVPETWVYVLPKGAPHPQTEQRQAIILVQERIPILSEAATAALWRDARSWTTGMIDELFTLFYRQNLEDTEFKNVRFTESRKQIAFFDLEVPTMNMKPSYQNLVQRMPKKSRERFLELATKNGLQLHR